MSSNFLLIYICNFHVLIHFLLIYICKLHWNRTTAPTYPSSSSRGGSVELFNMLGSSTIPEAIDNDQSEVQMTYSYTLLLLSLLLAGMWIFGVCYVMNVTASLLAELIGISSSVMGLTAIALGTSLPNILSSVNLSRQGLGGIVITNMISSNIFGVFINLGVPWLILIITKKGNSYDGIKDDGIVFSVMILIALSISFVLLVVCYKFILHKWMWLVFLVLYIFYLAYGISSKLWIRV